MAKKYHSARAAKGTVNKGAIAIIVTILIAALLLGAAVGVMGYGTSGFKDWGFSRFAHKTPAAYEQEEEIPDMGGSTIIEEAETSGMTMLTRAATMEEVRFYAPALMQENPENVFHLSVTYEPEDTTFQETDYSIAFKNPGSTWAQGKNPQDYVQLTHVEDSKEATLTILKPFSEQIIVTATNKRHTNVYVKTTVDYVCEWMGLRWNLEGDSHCKIDPDSDYGFDQLGFAEGTIHFELNNNVELALAMPNLKAQGFDLGDYYKITLEFEGETCVSELSFGSLLHEAVNAKYESEQATKCWQAVQRYFATAEDGDGISSYSINYNRIYKGKNYGYKDMTDDTIRGQATIDPFQDIEVSGDSFKNYFEVVPDGVNSNTPGGVVTG